MNKLFAKNAWLLFLLAASAISVYIETRSAKDLPDAYIGHADQAQVALIARNIAEGRGAVAECYWLLHDVESTDHSSLPKREGYWSAYSPYVIAIFFKIFGCNRFSLLLAASLTKALIALIAYFACLHCSKHYFCSFGCGIVLLLHASMVNRVNGLSDIYLTLATTCFATCICFGIHRTSYTAWIVAGLSAGFAIGIKPTGILLIVVYPSLFFFGEKIKKLLLPVGISIAAFLITLIPYLLGNIHNDSLLLPPDYTRVASGMNLMHQYQADHNEWLYDPDQPASQPLGTNQRLKIMARAMVRNLQLLQSKDFILTLLCISVLSIAVGLVKYWKTGFKCDSFEQLFKAITFTLFVTAVVLASQIHYEPRYFNYVIPPFVIIAFSWIATIPLLERKVLTTVAIVIVLLTYTVNTWLSEPQFKWQKEYVSACEIAKRQLPKDATVFTSDPWEFAFHAKRKSVMIPYTSSDETIKRIANRFDVDYLVVINGYLRHDQFKEMLESEPPDYLTVLHEEDGLRIYEIQLN